jgi:propionyl-CoA synthetase
MNWKEHHQVSIAAPEQYWSAQAAKIEWYRQPDTPLTYREDGTWSWFNGGMLNTCYLALDRHVENGRGDEQAMIYDSPVTQTKRIYSYRELRDETARIAGGLKQLGVNRGDTVIIYMPMIPQAVMTMLACARIGAVHSVVFGGFAPQELALRIDDAHPKVIVTASSGIEVDRIIPYKPMVDEALELAQHAPEKVVIFKRQLGATVPEQAHDIDFDHLVTNAEPVGCVPVEATDPLYVLYTSGTTGKPKGVVRENGGHAVALNYSMEYIYDIHEGDVFWAASDIGWVVGHSYIVYAPLIRGAATVLFEGKPIRTPDASTFWRIIEENKVNVMFTAPTAIRAIRKEDPTGEFIQKHDLSSLRYQFLAGERCDVSTLTWLSEQLNIPVIDHWWQTESGWPMVANYPGIERFETKPGSVSKPVPGYHLQILDHNGEPAPANTEGYVAIKLPLPPGCLNTLWNDREGFISGYLQRFDGYYFSGDGGYIDEDGYVFITGRVDDIINVAGHRLSTAEMEEVVAGHHEVAECAVVGVRDELKGEIPLAIVVVRNDDKPFIETSAEIIQMVRETIGPVASLKTVIPVKRLPKTRSGKTLRKLLRAIANGDEFKIPSTIDEPAIVDEIKNVMAVTSIR